MGKMTSYGRLEDMKLGQIPRVTVNAKREDIFGGWGGGKFANFKD